MSKVRFREIKGRNVQYLEEGGKWTSTGKGSLDSIGIDSEGRPQYSLRTTFMTNISNTMSKDKVMLLMGHKQWRECYDKRTAEDLIKNFKTM